MPDYSLSPVRRAQGYLTAQVEWRICSLDEALLKYEQILARLNVDNANTLYPQKPSAKPRSNADREMRLVKRLDRRSGIRAPFCRGYLFALVEKKYIKADLAKLIVREVGFTSNCDEFWLTDYPDQQSHPLYPLSMKMDATYGMSAEERLLAALWG